MTTLMVIERYVFYLSLDWSTRDRNLSVTKTRLAGYGIRPTHTQQATQSILIRNTTLYSVIILYTVSYPPSAR